MFLTTPIILLGSTLHLMFRATVMTGSALASYFENNLAHGDYYAHNRHVIGIWGGVAAEKLGFDIGDEVNKADFTKLCKGINPHTDEKLTQRLKENRRAAIEVCVNAPKSFSAAHALSNDETLKAGLEDDWNGALNDTLMMMEGEVKTRVRKSGATNDRVTGNMLYARFRHLETRPVEGRPDPHFHEHVVIMNYTHDSVEQRGKALELRDFKRDMPYFEAVFHANLAKRLAGRGLNIRKTEKRWEIEGVPDSVIEKFSTRTKHINKNIADYEKENGKTLSVQARAETGALTREKKDPSITLDAMKEEWNSRLTAEERAAIDNIKLTGRDETDKSGTDATISAAKAMDLAIDDMFERRSAVSPRELETRALQYGVGSVTPEDIKKHINERLSREDIIREDFKGKEYLTTQKVINEERAMIAYARAGRGKHRPLRSERIQGDYEFKNDKLSDEQKDAINGVLGSFDTVNLIQGRAGTGKTTVLREIAHGINEGGGRLHAFTITSEAKDTLRRDGFAGAETVANLKANETLQADLKGGVIWIDESGLLSTKDMQAIFHIAKQQEARILLSGDTSQHHGIERGDAQRLLEQRSGIHTHRLSQIHRQKPGDYKRAVSELSQGNIDAGYNALEKMGSIIEIADDETRNNALASDYVQSLKDNKSALVVSPTHAEGQQVTALIRQKLKQTTVPVQNSRDTPDETPKEEPLLKNDDREFTSLKNLNWTQIQRETASNYQRGQIVKFHQNAKGFIKSQRFTITGRDKDGNVTMSGQDGITRILPTAQAGRFSVYDTHQLSVATGDKLRITQGGRSLDGTRLNNGQIYEVRGFTQQGDIRIASSRKETVLSKDYGNFNHGYVTTSHSSQGKTVDRVFIAESSLSYGAASKEQFYVSVSRGRQQVKVYTDDKQELKERIGHSERRISATELQEQKYKKQRAQEREYKRITDYYRSNRDDEAKTPVLTKDFNHKVQPQPEAQKADERQPQPHPAHPGKHTGASPEKPQTQPIPPNVSPPSRKGKPEMEMK